MNPSKGVAKPRIPSNLRNWAWTAVVIVLSQLPYRNVWLGRSTFPYDAYTTFSPWNIARLASLRDGHNWFGFFDVGLPGEIWPSFFFTGVVQQLCALVQPNTALAHAVVQALHAALLVPATAWLFRTFGVRWRYGVVGGAVFALSGIHVSLAQHVYAHEALLYLVCSLVLIRLLLTGLGTDSPRRTFALWLATVLALVSLVRVHHEAILYVAPLGLWAGWHVVRLYRSSGARAATRGAGLLAAAAALVAICSIPMLLSAYELSLTNKTQPYSYAQLQPYFHDPRTFGLGLLLPDFTSLTRHGYPFPYGFGQDSTLAYIFFGSLTIAFYAAALSARLRRRRFSDAALLVVLPVVLLAYTYGPGNPIHRGITAALPFLVQIGHGYYGFHLLYLVTAFGVACGLQQVVEGRERKVFAWAQAATLTLVTYMSVRAAVQGGWGLSGSVPAFLDALQRDTRWLANITIVVVLAVAIAAAGWLQRGTGAGERFRRHAPAALFAVLALAILWDMVRPVWRAHFVPNAGSALVQADPIGGFNLSRDIEAYFRASHQRGEVHRVLPLFEKAGGWRPNALLPLGVTLVHAPADSGGNLHVSALLDQGPSSTTVDRFIDDYGVDEFWVSRWGMDAWQETLRTHPRLRLVYTSAYGGDIYQAAGPTSSKRGFHWDAFKPRVSDGIVARSWRFDALPPGASDSLPLMWHAAYDVRDATGRRVATTADAMGRLALTSSGRVPVTVRYPGPTLTLLVGLSALLYLALLAALCALGAQELVRRRRSGSS